MRNQIALRSRDPLTFDQMRRVAPSIFAAAAHDSRSDRYTYVPTVTILERLQTEGFQVFEVGQSRTRDLSRREFTKHMVKMRRGDGPREVGQEMPEIVLINSHDGTSAYQMLAGMFRLVCLNGLVVPAGIVEDVRVPHTGDIAGRVIEGAFTVLETFERVRDNADRMKALTLSDAEANAFARAAIVAKYGEPEVGAMAPITERQALAQRRAHDSGADLWSTFNRVQENLVRGGLSTRSANGRRMRTREVQGISQNVQLNRALWTLADEMSKLKAAA
jgi:hypothetical protein